MTVDNTIVLHPGDVACGDRGDRLETLLGSCVAIVLTDPRRTVGVMCHIVHARPPAVARDAASAAYAPQALWMMQRLLLERGITPQLCEAWVYGGGNMFPQMANAPDVGERNTAWALRTLAEQGVRVLRHDTGGHAYRRLAWTIGPGEPEVTAVPV